MPPVATQVLLTVGLLHAACVAFGASIWSLDCTVIVYVAASLPLVLSFGWRRGLDWYGEVMTIQGSHRDGGYAARLMASLVAAWCGAFFTVMDWAVWWQRWPVLSAPLALTVGFIAAALKLQPQVL